MPSAVLSNLLKSSGLSAGPLFSPLPRKLISPEVARFDHQIPAFAQFEPIRRVVPEVISARLEFLMASLISTHLPSAKNDAVVNHASPLLIGRLAQGSEGRYGLRDGALVPGCSDCGCSGCSEFGCSPVLLHEQSASAEAKTTASSTGNLFSSVWFLM
jgi:hypothetical protein